MQLVPVIDLMGGLVVQGHQGQRHRYRPVSSQLTQSSEPLTVARALLQASHARHLYVADLDAIQEKGEHLATLRQLANALPAELWVDAGISDPEAARRLLEWGAGRVIIGSETLPDLHHLEPLRSALPAERLSFSLDIRDGQVLSVCPALRQMEPQLALRFLAEEGWDHIILLSLGRVGTGGGPDIPLLRTARETHPTLTLVAGGGIRSPQDLQVLDQLEMNAVLLATALHRGWIRFTNGSVDEESSPVHFPSSRK